MEANTWTDQLKALFIEFNWIQNQSEQLYFRSSLEQILQKWNIVSVTVIASGVFASNGRNYSLSSTLSDKIYLTSQWLVRCYSRSCSSCMHCFSVSKLNNIVWISLLHLAPSVSLINTSKNVDDNVSVSLPFKVQTSLNTKKVCQANFKKLDNKNSIA